MLADLLSRNKAWSAQQCADDPAYFNTLAKGQSPEFFWIGCSDSRVPANVVAGLAPGEVFVHRNVANVVHSSDMNLLSALEFAVDALNIREVIVCGHYGCGGVRAACEHGDHGLADHWLEPIRRLARTVRVDLPAQDDEDSRNMLAELNVRDGVQRIVETPIIRAAWDSGKNVKVHGLIYDIHDGLLRNLGCTRSRDSA